MILEPCHPFGLQLDVTPLKVAALTRLSHTLAAHRLIAAIFLWKTRCLEQAFVELERQSVYVAPTIVTHVAPLGWEHVGLTGDYVWSDGQQPPNGSIRPLRRRESMLAA